MIAGEPPTIQQPRVERTWRTAMKILFPRWTCPSLFLACAFLLAGCGGGGSSSGPISLSAPTPSGLTASLAQGRSSVGTGGTVHYTLTLTNSTSAPITVQEFQGPYDAKPRFPGYLDINNAAGITLYTTSQPYFLSPNAPSITVPNPPAPTGHNVAVTVAAGQTLSVSYDVSAFADGGRYSAMAVFAPGGVEDVNSVRTSVGPLNVTAGG